MLLQITQNFGESSSDYVTHFEEQCSAVNQSTDDPTALEAFIEGIEDGKLRIQMETRTKSYSIFEELQVNLRKWEDMVRRKEGRQEMASGRGNRPVKRLRVAAIEREENLQTIESKDLKRGEDLEVDRVCTEKKDPRGDTWFLL
uniref:Retrotransposon gag domain-containing protein n=1 Tax=Chromera velia CCMP2878 TaxID=1169474 RepID=A0A0G4GFV4_9ALVE|eukprot:Cvel_4647.t1-p1 / transcript=Cvel_4647.t1 / gene=Cvel_4647 / organism=Chromera_velia_CCMP2878 / gene_product=hypothetical protein / transcript_product=hypothetical protein / location=Cvel_scaffold205:49986-50414(-) / protein_length=143 / sequence_SO=supercontig / SO=protein_coding / is_pseudo=false